jgi:hypothetical protein
VFAEVVVVVVFINSSFEIGFKFRSVFTNNKEKLDSLSEVKRLLGYKSSFQYFLPYVVIIDRIGFIVSWPEIFIQYCKFYLKGTSLPMTRQTDLSCKSLNSRAILMIIECNYYQRAKR